jgi:Flp pilus assembly protein TadB
VRIPTFSRHPASDTAEDERRTTATGNTTPVRERTDAPPRGTATVAGPTEATTMRWAEKDRADANRTEDRTAARAARDAQAERDARAARSERDAANRDANVDLADRDPDRTDRMERIRDTDRAQPGARRIEPAPDTAAGPRPRASLLATLGLILAVASALLVLSGPLLGYGIGVAVLALILSLSGIHATGKRHVAGKSDALIGMFVSLAAIVVGVLALTGSLSWLGTDMQPVSSLRHWLDAQFVNRF